MRYYTVIQRGAWTIYSAEAEADPVVLLPDGVVVAAHRPLPRCEEQAALCARGTRACLQTHSQRRIAAIVTIAR